MDETCALFSCTRGGLRGGFAQRVNAPRWDLTQMRAAAVSSLGGTRFLASKMHGKEKSFHGGKSVLRSGRT